MNGWLALATEVTEWVLALIGAGTVLRWVNHGPLFPDRVGPLLDAHQAAEDDLKMRDAIRHAGPPGLPSLGMAPGHTWPGDCQQCVWWIPAPSEAEDAIAVYRPCPQHDPALWAEFERAYKETSQ